MSRGFKSVELMNDPLNRLPDDVLNTIICKLELKDAAKTSVLSKRWRYVWINHPDLHFTHLNVLGFDYSQLKRNWVGVDTIFVNFVDQIMKQRFKGEDKINSFCLRFELGKPFSHCIDKWISYAVRKDVETIDLDFSRFPFNASRYSSFNHRFARYNFSLLRTTSENKGSLKHLRLSYCNFMGRSSSKKFDSLVSLKLLKVNISDIQLTKVLECCSLLQELSLHNCSNKLTYLSFGDLNNNTRLKVLSLKNCLKLREINLICAHNLFSLELESINISDLQLAKFLEICPILEELTLNTCSQLMYLRIDNSNSSCLKNLSLNSCSNLRETRLCASNLHTLSFTGHKGSFYFQRTPNLVNVFIGENINGMHPFSLLESETSTC
ncbi:F-box/LRR-repeat protein At3g03360-like [Impatiens glandulifera]|uniref:F-box/LRR-repeat protein At3g03360-like n=1 Tax=Impatiens glandulifera TaxID=253017 RepID=UPI001FB101C7|nr:F-box/LRR-repeat protein At3g03360-like [Impatiens glandulifera]